MATKTSEKVILSATKRESFGKQVKKLRKQGLMPANIYGKDFPSTAIFVDYKEFVHVHDSVGETGIVHVHIKGEDKDIPTLIKLVQLHPLSGSILHADLRKVNMRQKIETEVPVTFINESPAVKKGAVVLYQLDSITIEALPSKIPSEIEIDLSKLDDVDQAVRVKDLPVSDDYTITTEPEAVIVSTTAHKEEEIEPDTSTTIPEETGEEAEGESDTSTESPTQDEASSEETKE